ncbi:MAG: hypothetical protein HKO56_04420 [Bacteroidia bacterium]|nr:hypothetical protein [Bacteroidia bacterium]
MASKCPEVLKMFVENPELLDELDDDEVETLFVEGEITDINTDNFVVFTLEEENSVQKKYYWFSSVKADLNIVSEYKSLLNKRVILYYQPEEFFDPKIDEYRIFNKIVEIEQ